LGRIRLVTVGKAVVAIVICQAAGLIGVLLSGDTREFYDRIEKPPLSPPPAVFGPVWTVLYALMGISLLIVWQRFRETGTGKGALALFGVQLGLNAIWSPIFFGLESPGGGLVVIGLLVIALVATMIAFQPISRTATLLLVPYLLWVLFATYLNIGIWWLN
jgi:translocator protein